MLDAAHGKSVGAVVRSERLDVALFETQETGVRMARCVGGRGPRKAADADIFQGSRVAVAVARSRCRETIAGMDGAEREQVQF